MKLVTLALLATTSLTFAQQRQFDNWDQNKDGKLSKEELPKQAQQNFSKVDTDGDCSISLSEHMAFRKRGQKPQQSEKLTIKNDISYADNDNPRQKLDLYLPNKPNTDKPLPVIAFIHGGAWRAGDKRSGLKRLRGELVGAGVTVGAD